MTKVTKTKLMALAAMDACMVAYIIFDMSTMHLECECERLEVKDWFFLGPISFILFGMVITAIYIICKPLLHFGYFLYKKFGK